MRIFRLKRTNIRLVAALALPFLWMFCLLFIDMSVSDIVAFGDQRWVAALVNLIFILAWCLLISSRSIMWRTRVIGSIVLLAVMSAALYQFRMEGVVLGIFGSPSDKSLKELAVKVNAPPAWIKDAYAPPRSACGSYCMDVWSWRFYRTMMEEFAE